MSKYVKRATWKDRLWGTDESASWPRASEKHCRNGILESKATTLCACASMRGTWAQAARMRSWSNSLSVAISVCLSVCLYNTNRNNNQSTTTSSFRFNLNDLTQPHPPKHDSSGSATKLTNPQMGSLKSLHPADSNPQTQILTTLNNLPPGQLLSSHAPTGCFQTQDPAAKTWQLQPHKTQHYLT